MHIKENVAADTLSLVAIVQTRKHLVDTMTHRQGFALEHGGRIKARDVSCQRQTTIVRPLSDAE